MIKKIIAKRIKLRKKSQVDHQYEIPKIPKQLLNTESKKDVEYLKYIKGLINQMSQDPMTGLYHKQHFQELEKEPGVFIYIDGDGIKKINDSFGHNAGHAAIEALARGIKNVMRNKDDVKITRFGGDEFVVHVKDISIATGVNIGKRILKSIQDQDVSKTFKGTKDIKEELSKMPLGASIGVGKTEAEADEALYKAKSKGRNRVEFFTKKK